MKSTLNSAYLLFKIIWNVSSKNIRLRTVSIIFFTIFSSILQYLSILITAYTFAYFTTSSSDVSQISEIENLFGFKALINNDSLFVIISIWLLISFSYSLSAALSTAFIYKNVYDIGNIITEKILKISIESNTIFHEKLSKKTLFNILTSENTALIRGSIMSLISLPMQLSVVIALASIIIQFSTSLFIVIPIIGITYLYIVSLILNKVRENSVIAFDFRSKQTDILTRFIENYLDVSFPPSNHTYRNLFNKITKRLRDKEAYNAMVPKIIKTLLELILFLIIGFYSVYTLKFLNMPVNYFISSSAAIIISIIKLAPVISAISSTFVSFENQYESIRKHYELFKNQSKYNLNSDKYNYSKVKFDTDYSLSLNSISSLRIQKLNKLNPLSKQFIKNKLIWITGRSGCGKSTLFSMIAGIRPINEGEIILSLNKTESKNSVSKNIYDYVAYLPQKPIFHTISVREYIRDGDFAINDETILRIIRILKLSKTFDIPSKELLDLIVGPGGFTPSGGQAKLLAFARTLCKRNVKLYLLDEPTADLNQELREIVLQVIYKLSKNKFVLSITHDLTSIRSYDEKIEL